MSFIERLICQECGVVMIKTPSGACCPEGHGRIQPGATEYDLHKARVLVWERDLPRFLLEKGKKQIFHRDGKRYRSTFTYETLSGVSYRVPKLSKELPGGVVGFCSDGKIRCLREIG